MNFTRDNITRRKKELKSLSTRFGTTLKAASIKFVIFAIVFVGVVGCALVLGMVSGILANTPDIETINVSPTKFATKVYDNQGNEIETLIAEGSNRVYVPLDQIPDDLKNAFVAVEDERFYKHNGIDLKGIARAASVAITNFNLSEGASTITQQLIKNTVFNAYNESTIEKIERKIQEQYLAIRIDAEMGKDAILENYLNIINLGNGNLGVQAAANNYFNKDVSELTLSECAVIAGITKNPIGYNPINHPENNRDRQLEVLKHMKEQGYITEAEYEEAKNDNVYDRIQDIHVETGGNSVYSYFTDKLIDVLIEDLVAQYGYTENQATNMIYSGGLSIYTTQDTQMQKIAEKVLNDPENYPADTSVSISLNLSLMGPDGKAKYLTHNNMLKYFQTDGGIPSFQLLFKDEETAADYVKQYKEYLESEGYEITYESLYYIIQPQISFTLIDQHTGEVKVIVGGRGEKETSRSINRATNTYRSPGSTIKPLAVYGPALDSGGLTLATVFDDCPYYYSSGQLVTNWDKKYKGIMTMRTALKLSQNIPAVKCLHEITPQLGFSYLQNFGLTTLVSPEDAINGYHDVIESLALGGMTNGVYNIDMCAAYAAYANDGVYTKPIYYTKVYDHDGNLILDNTEPQTHRVVKDTTAWLMTSAMQSVVTEGTGTKCKIPNQPVAGKTGTSNSDGDLWFVGYTPYYTAAIWTGYDDNNTRAVKVDHRTLWSKIMTEIHEDLPTGSFTAKPETIVEVQVCAQSGQLPVEGLCDADERGSQIITEYFAVGTEPTETCTAHGVYPVCGETGKLSVGTCPASYRIMVKRPPNNTVVPEEAKDDVYEVADSAYTIPYELEEAVCPVHGSWYLEQLGIVTTPNSDSESLGPSVDDFMNGGQFNYSNDDSSDD
ncbi:MAG: PBP1A family penicillin-binding protein [Thermoflexaceae bacterium]|nr:PBP1A family penicillin-binding protein [Thermoflexaceae bacterium]